MIGRSAASDNLAVLIFMTLSASIATACTLVPGTGSPIFYNAWFISFEGALQNAKAAFDALIGH
jgi:hypothetical protein